MGKNIQKVFVMKNNSICDLAFFSQEFKQEVLGGYVRTPPQSLGGHGNKNLPDKLD